MDTRASWLAALDARIEREILRLRARYELSLDEFRGLYVSDEHVDRLIAGAHTPSAPDLLAVIERPAAGLRDLDDRWRHVAETFGLCTLEEDLLLIGAAPELDLKYETLYAYLNNDVTRKWPTADLARRLLSDVAGNNSVAGALAPAATLHAQHLIYRVDGPGGRPAMLHAGYALHPCVTHWLHGHSPSLAFEAGATVWSSGAALEFDDAARARAEPIQRVLHRWSPSAGNLPVIALLGQPGSGRATTAAALAALTGRPLVRLHLHALADADAEAVDMLDRVQVALSLEPAVVLVEGVDVPADDEARRPRHEARLARAVARWPASALVLIRTSDDDRWRAFAGARRVIEVRCEVGSFAGRLALWRDAARSESIRLPDAELHSLAGRFSLTPGHVRATLATARDLATMAGAHGQAGSDQVAAAARLASDQALGRLAVKVDRKHDWADLVLPPPTLRRLRELAAAIRHRHVVYGEWGFGERIINGTGIKALFAGGSGTGKTMAAGVMARELGLDLYKIDLSGVVSKYIGETEKNLDRIFRAARAANAIVFLDEAEAIMGKRSEVKDAHDRYANIEVAYLLQRLEDHDGIVILATNLKRNIDDAFNRRMQYVVDFPRPEEGEREQIWRRMFPPQSPIGTDVDFAFLARQFDLAGGDIRNVVLDAAFLAAQDGGVIGMRAIVEALARQLAKEGKTPTGTDFRQYQRLLPAAGGRHDAR
jgi:hypothetical protein